MQVQQINEDLLYVLFKTGAMQEQTKRSDIWTEDVRTKWSGIWTKDGPSGQAFGPKTDQVVRHLDRRRTKWSGIWTEDGPSGQIFGPKTDQAVRYLDRRRTKRSGIWTEDGPSGQDVNWEPGWFGGPKRRGKMYKNL